MLVTLDNLSDVWLTIEREDRAEIVYMLQGQGVSQAKIAFAAGVSPRNIRSRKADANSYILSGIIPSGKFEVDVVRSEVVDAEMDRRDRLVSNRQARQNITNSVVAQGILDLVMDAVEAQGVIDSARVQLDTPWPVEGAAGLETAIMHVSDLHYCRSSDDMTEETIQAALWKYRDESMSIINRQRKHCTIKKLVILLNGDNIHGLHNFLSQSRETTGSMSYQIWKASKLFINFIDSLVPDFESIEVVCLGGNHGKMTPKDDLMTENAEFAMGFIIQAYFSAFKSVTVDVAYGSFYRIVDVQGYKFFVTHGDAISGGGSPESIIAAVKRWDMTGTIPPFDSAILGHFHRLNLFPIPPKYGDNKSRKIFVGGTASRDDRFLEGLGSTPSLQYWLLFANSKRVTAFYDIDLYE